MCFFSKPKTPEFKPVPAPPPTPIPQPSEVSPLAEDEARRRRLERQKSGFAATLKTGPRGVVGAGPELQPRIAGRVSLG
jgi:hypothetical protein